MFSTVSDIIKHYSSKDVSELREPDNDLIEEENKKQYIKNRRKALVNTDPNYPDIYFAEDKQLERLNLNILESGDDYGVSITDSRKNGRVVDDQES